MKLPFGMPVIITAALLAGCARPGITLAGRSSAESTSTPTCPQQTGTTVSDRVFFTDRGEDHVITVHLPPCYAEYSQADFPVLYWTNGYGRFGFDTADRLIRQGNVPAFIIVEVGIDPAKGAGADAEIIQDVVPYIDTHYRTLGDPRQRSITGISNGAAIAIRAAFQPPYLFGRVAVLSGGIADGEQQKFSDWVRIMPPGQRPEVLIDVGDQDGIMLLTGHLTDLLDELKYPYTFSHAPGDHNEAFWSSRMAYYLEWLMSGQ